MTTIRFQNPNTGTPMYLTRSRKDGKLEVLIEDQASAAAHDGAMPTWTFCESSLSARRVGDPITTSATFRDEHYKITASIVLDPKRTNIRVSFYHATRYNRALAEAARLYAMILDTYEDLLEVAERVPREARLAIDRPVLDGASVRIVGADALVALYGFFGDAIEEIA